MSMAQSPNNAKNVTSPKEKPKAPTEKQIDQSVAESFPASDPPAHGLEEPAPPKWAKENAKAEGRAADGEGCGCGG